MSKKKYCHRLTQREQELRQIEKSLDTLQRVGLIGQSRVVDGEKQYYVGPEHLAMMLEILRHPEKWPDTWNDEQRAKWHAARDKAITKGLIEP